MKTRLRQFVTKANTGADAIKRAPIVEHDTGVKCLRTSDVSNNNPFDRWGFCEVSDKHYKQYSLKKNDIIIARTGPIGKCYFVQNDLEAVYNNGLMRIRVDETDVFPQFVFYCLRAGHFEEYIKQVGSGSATRPNIKMDIALDYEIEKLDISNQRKVAAILSAYDDLIENNLRRVKILEEMAQLIYQEWFVHFRFPGHENTEFIDSPLGKIPVGWEVVTLKDLVECRRGSTVAGEHLSDRFYVPIDCIPRRSLALLEAKSWEEAKSSLQLFKEGDILFGAMRPYFHKVAIAPFSGVTRTTCFILRPHRKELFAYATMTLFQEETIQFATAHTQGATIPYAVWDGSLADMAVVLPPKLLLTAFDDLVSPMLRVFQTAFFKMRNLHRTRDLLLPKLISGELDVSELDVNVGEEPT